MYLPTNENPADLISRGCSVNKLKTSSWMHEPERLIMKDCPNQSSENVVVNELTVEVNPIAAIPPSLDLSKYSKLAEVLGVARVWCLLRGAT